MWKITIDNSNSIPVRVITLSLSLVFFSPCASFAQAPSPVISQANPPQTITIDELLTYASTHAPNVLTAQTYINTARADLTSAQILTPFNPEIWLSLGTRTSLGLTGLEAETSIQQQIEIGGERDLRIAHAQAVQEQTTATVAEIQWALHVEIHTLSTQLLLAQEREKLTQIFIEFNEHLSKIAQRQVDAGEISPLVLLVAQTDLAQAQSQLISAQQHIRILQAKLAATSGWPSTHFPHFSDILPPIQKAPPDHVLLSQMQQHPALRARDLAVSSAHHKISLENRESWPSPTVGLSYAYEGQIGQESHVWLATIGVPLPFWQSNQGEQAHAAAQLETAKISRTITEIQLSTLLAEATSRLNAAVDLVAIYEKTIIPSSQQSLSQLQRAYDLGEVDIHQVSQTRERLLLAHQQHLEAKIQYYEAAAQLEGLIGVEIWDLLNGAQQP